MMAVTTDHGGTCQSVDGPLHTYYYDDCFASGLGWDSGLETYTLSEGPSEITIRENHMGHWGNSMCDSGAICTATVQISFQQVNPMYIGMSNPYQTIFTQTLTVAMT